MSITEPEFRALFDRYLKGNASPAERKLLDQFFDSYRDEHPQSPGINPDIRDEILNDLRKKKDVSIQIIPIRRTSPWLAVAAAVAVVVVAAYFLFTRGSTTTEQIIAAKTVDYTTARGQKANVVLPDGTQVKLNSNSHITYPEKFSGSTREVTLQGEAYFDVTHDEAKPFIVRTGETSTKVLGTSFNVNSKADAVTVTLVEGKVKVSTSAASAMLTPNQQATISSTSKEIITNQVDVTQYTAWTNNQLIFENMKVEDAFTALENWYNVDIDVRSEAIKDCVITAKYENESLQNVLNSFRFMLKMEYTIDKHVVSVSGKGCN